MEDSFDYREEANVPNEQELDKVLRPKSLQDFAGQPAVVENLEVFVRAAQLRNEPLDHVLLHGPPGLGKTTLANIIANELGVGFKITSGPVLDKAGDLAGLLTNLGEGDVLFIDEIHRLHALAPIRLITLAPEVGGNEALIAQLVAEGFKVQLGHTTGSYEQGVAALRCGATGFTHLFNAMSALHHREPGMVGAALAHAEFAEVIPDLLHVHPGAIHAALRAIPKLYCVTDSTSAAGMPDGDYKLGRHTVTKCMGGVRLADGTLAGSVLSMDQALRNLVNTLGLSLADASSRVSTFAADHMGLADRGRLQTGAWADAVVLNRDLQVQAVVVEGYAVRNT